MRECAHPWGIYIQADEVLHEEGAPDLAAAIQRVRRRPTGGRAAGPLRALLWRVRYRGHAPAVVPARGTGGPTRSRAGRTALSGGAGFSDRSGAPEDQSPAHQRRDVSLRLGSSQSRPSRKSGSWDGPCIPGGTPTRASPCWPGFLAFADSMAVILPRPGPGSRLAGTIPSALLRRAASGCASSGTTSPA